MALNLFGLARRPDDTGLSPVYLAHQRDYNERYGIHTQNARRWRYTAWGCIAVVALAVGWQGYQSTLPKFTPFVVERDHLGDSVAVGLADRQGHPDMRAIQHEVRAWIHNVRAVTVDAQTEKDHVWNAYYHTDATCPAKGELDEWFTKNDPFKRAEESIVTITIPNALPTEPHNWHTWKLDWREESRTRGGDLIGPPQAKEASITVNYRAPESEDDYQKNPSGYYVCSFDWKT